MKRPIEDPHGITWTWNSDFEIYETSAFSSKSSGPVYALERFVRTGEVSSFWLRHKRRTR